MPDTLFQRLQPHVHARFCLRGGDMALANLHLRLRNLSFSRPARQPPQAKGRNDADLYMLYALHILGNINAFAYVDSFVPCDSCTIAMHVLSWANRTGTATRRQYSGSAGVSVVLAGYDAIDWAHRNPERAQLVSLFSQGRRLSGKLMSA
jgi:hypothetical protein